MTAEIEMIRLDLTRDEAEVLKVLTTIAVDLAGLLADRPPGLPNPLVAARRAGLLIHLTPGLSDAYNSLADKLNMIPQVWEARYGEEG